MPFRGITFDKQVLKSQDHAHEVNYYYQGDIGVTKGCTITENVDGNLVIDGGYFIINGRLVAIDGSQLIVVPEVLSGTKYCVLVFEIDLTKTNTVSVFNQGSFKILQDNGGYPSLIQQDLNNGGTLFQMEFARFTNSANGVASLSQSYMPILDIDKYAPLKNPVFLEHPKAPTQAFNDNTTDIATDQFVQSQVRRMEIKSPGYSSNFTLNSSDIGKLIEVSTVSNLNITVPLDSTGTIPIGSMFMFVVYNTTYNVTFVSETGAVEIWSQDSKKKVNNKNYTVVTLIRFNSNAWLLFGDLIA